MAQPLPSHNDRFDVGVVGAGCNGATAALALARAGFSCVCLGAYERAGRGRTVALFGRSLDLLRRLGVWEKAESFAAPLRALRLVDDTVSLFAPRPIEFYSREIGLEAFGWNIENLILINLLAAEIDARPEIARRPGRLARLRFAADAARLVDEAGDTFEASLIVGADGRDSPTRKAAGLAVRSHRYGQSSLTLTLTHARPHDDVSTEFHTREGPFTLVPLPPTATAANRSSLVWVMGQASGERRRAMDDEALAREIERQSRGLLGTIRIEGERGIFPLARQYAPRLTATRVALIGDAAHVFPPIGAQGLNLGLRDVEDLVGVASSARERGDDIGANATLAAYAQSRFADIAERMIAVNGLNLSLLADSAPIDALRGFGLAALGSLAPLRRFVMREGLSPQWAR